MDCQLREWRIEDAERIAEILADKTIARNLRDGLPDPYTVADGGQYISAMLTADKNDTFAFAVTVDGTVVGSIAAFRQSNIHSRTAELGYYLAKEYRGRGIMTLAVKKLCEYVFSRSDILRLYAEPFARNRASCRVLEKAGFTAEGVLRANAVKCGVVEDMVMYSLLKSDRRERGGL